MDLAFSLWTLFTSSFLAATLLPGGSELVLYGVLTVHPDEKWTAIGIATLGNTLGGLTSYAIGRLVPRPKPLDGLDHDDPGSTPLDSLDRGNPQSKPLKGLDQDDPPSKSLKGLDHGNPRSTPLKALDTLQRYGPPALLLSWVPFIGDPLCVAAGWLRFNVVLATFFIAAGKFGRYVVISTLA
jgi:membrane protein YqaA with SNARE-associated domain